MADRGGGLAAFIRLAPGRFAGIKTQVKNPEKK